MTDQERGRMSDELKIPDDLRECYDACVDAQKAGCGENAVDAETEIILIERIAKLEALVRDMLDRAAAGSVCNKCFNLRRRADELLKGKP